MIEPRDVPQRKGRFVASDGVVARLHHLDRLDSPGRIVAERRSRIRGLAVDPAAATVAVRTDEIGGEVPIWSLTADRPTRIRSVAMSKPQTALQSGGQTYQKLYADYTTDGGHLDTDLGHRCLARGW